MRRFCASSLSAGLLLGTLSEGASRIPQLDSSSSSPSTGPLPRSLEAVGETSVNVTDGSPFVGCFVYDVSEEANYITVATNSTTMTNKECEDSCMAVEKKYSMTFQGDTCVCTDVLPALSANAEIGEACNKPCAGSRNETCGGMKEISVYDAEAAQPTSTTPAPTEIPEAFPFFNFSQNGTVQRDPLRTCEPYVGCYRFLQEDHHNFVWAMEEAPIVTNRMCMEACFRLGYKYSATFKGNDCACSNDIPAMRQKEDDCDEPCSGDAQEHCGSSHDASLYKTECLAGPGVCCLDYLGEADELSKEALENPALARASAGKVKEPNSTLEDASSSLFGYPKHKRLIFAGSDPKMDNWKCMEMCHEKGYTVSGTMGGFKCFCGSFIDSAPSDKCDMECPGDSRQVCGSLPSLESKGGSMTVVGVGCGCAGTIGELPPLPPVCTTTTTTVAVTTTTTRVSKVPEHGCGDYIGCFVFKAEEGDQEGWTIVAAEDASMNNAKCSQLCATAEGGPYAFSGTQQGRNCWCSDNLPPSMTGKCKWPCSSDAWYTEFGLGYREICGGEKDISITAQACPEGVSTTPAPGAVTTTTTTTTEGICDHGAEMGCYQFRQADMGEWTFEIEESEELTVETCLWKCQQKGAKWTGLFKGKDCLCSDIELTKMDEVPLLECSEPCSGEGVASCGGSHDITVLRTECCKVLGCYAFEDQAGWEQINAEPGNEMTNEKCLEMCATSPGGAGFGFSATLDGNVCLCSASLELDAVASDECSKPCAGQSLLAGLITSKEMCGGGTSLTVSHICPGMFGKKTVTTTLAVTTPFPETACDGGDGYAGCFLFDDGKAEEAGWMWERDNEADVSVEGCQFICRKLGREWSALKNGTDCICGDGDLDAFASADSSEEEECSFTCAAGLGQKECGGVDAVSVYQTECGTSVGCFAFDEAAAVAAGAVILDEKKGGERNDACMAACAKHGGGAYPFSATFNGTRCACLPQAPASTDRVNDEQCDALCAGETLGVFEWLGWTGREDLCGGEKEASVFSICPEILEVLTPCGEPKRPSGETKHRNATRKPDHCKVELGCFDFCDTAQIGWQFVSPWYDLSPSECVNACNDKHFTYAVATGGDRCACANFLNLRETSELNCTAPCPGDEKTFCGGKKTGTVWSVDCALKYKDIAEEVEEEEADMKRNYDFCDVELGCFSFLKPEQKGWEWVKKGDAGMNPKSCVEACLEKGKKFAGGLDGGDCVCGDTINGGELTEKDCHLRCRGDSETFCGGSQGITVWATDCVGGTTSTTAAPVLTEGGNVTTTTTPGAAEEEEEEEDLGITYAAKHKAAETGGFVGAAIGCFRFLKDKGDQQGWTFIAEGDNAMTNEKCEMLCARSDKGHFGYSGTSKGTDCACSETLNLRESDPGKCTDTCTGASFMSSVFSDNSKCGGSHDLLVSRACKTPTELGPAAGYESSDISFPSGPAPETSIDSGASFGCFEMKKGTPGWTSVSTGDGGMTNERCIHLCASEELPLAATMKGSDCLCGSALVLHKDAKASACNAACGGAPFFSSEKCGGAFAVDVYRACAKAVEVTTTTTTTVAAIAETEETTCGDELGCFRFHRAEGDQDGWEFLAEDNHEMTNEDCMKMCKGFLQDAGGFSGTLKGTDCVCKVGEDITALSPKLSDEECAMPCEGSSSLFFGGSDMCGDTHAVTISKLCTPEEVEKTLAGETSVAEENLSEAVQQAEEEVRNLPASSRNYLCVGDSACLPSTAVMESELVWMLKGAPGLSNELCRAMCIKRGGFKHALTRGGTDCACVSSHLSESVSATATGLKNKEKEKGRCESSCSGDKADIFNCGGLSGWTVSALDCAPGSSSLWSALRREWQKLPLFVGKLGEAPVEAVQDRRNLSSLGLFLALFLGGLGLVVWAVFSRCWGVCGGKSGRADMRRRFVRVGTDGAESGVDLEGEEMGAVGRGGGAEGLLTAAEREGRGNENEPLSSGPQ
uniref:WSC domain-containing protein n=1 Tax=Chromera velia CCMP2878 TaxID=1169474 RepID=A0A0G4H0K1_9ALVE|eukprot:Cvel_5510.t1-p1 / transcript=Cvel_5510.t1 / gene=Cvel_5510 / organism=Chromera_velia_CCMP2878 / gene_product=Putative fungistatic metabolite, putative / transcript_product=Putative fungistatic metabolite, putative / location=Cvel_scaffold258:10748-36130(+) / protein_length=1973 / sequence_SO=supercontig / SO=protein_coding / is_pseudo=false